MNDTEYGYRGIKSSLFENECAGLSSLLWMFENL